MRIKNLPDKIFLNVSATEEEVDYNELSGVTFSTEPIGVTDGDTYNVEYVRKLSKGEKAKRAKDVADAQELQRKLFANGEVAYYLCDGRLAKSKIEEFVKQPLEGLLYDLNRDEATVCLTFPQVKVMNELATINVLKYLHRVATDPDFCCGGCVHFQNEDAEGKGICDVTDECRNCDYTCGKCKKKE